MKGVSHMFDYISAIYHGDPFHAPAADPFEDETTALSLRLAQVRAALGDAFAQKLAGDFRAELCGAQATAFRDGIQLGGRLMLNILEDVDG